MPPRAKHDWLRAALADKGYRQKDVAKAWGSDDAVISRFIKEGKPELSFDRAQVLARMVGMSLDELKVRLSEGIAPRKAFVPASMPAADEPRTETDSVQEAMSDLHAAAARVRSLLPEANVVVSITYEGK